MVRFFLDENVPVRLARMLQDRDQEVLTVRGSLMRDTSDDALLVYAVEHDYIFVTRNKDDFVLLHGAWVRWSSRWGVSE
jgi:predicted nuclease of predicted toxin-antitoxin system